MNTAKVYFKQNMLFGTKSIQKFCFKKKIINNWWALISFITLLHNASTLPKHYVTKNQNVTIVTLLQNALSLYNAKCNNVIKSEN